MAMQQAATRESIVDHIKKDHRKTSEEIMELEKRTRGRRDDSLDPVFAPMKKELLGHMAAEEKLLYPLLDKEMRQQMQDARREHEEIRKHLDHLAAGSSMPEDEWARHLQMMKQGIEHHVQDEEGRILPAAQRIVGDQRLRELGTEFTRMEEQYR
ncbi:MAG: hemerythrin domain-containing protein [Methanospirillum sp.]